MTLIRTRCDHHGVVDVDSTEVVIDDQESVYRLACPEGGHPVERRMDHKVRKLLRSVQVPTIEEVVASAKGVLGDDKEIWREVES